MPRQDFRGVGFVRLQINDFVDAVRHLRHFLLHMAAEHIITRNQQDFNPEVFERLKIFPESLRLLGANIGPVGGVKRDHVSFPNQVLRTYPVLYSLLFSGRIW